jgi:hypothetical protein
MAFASGTYEYESSNPYGATSADRLKAALAGTTYGASRAGTRYGGTRRGIDKKYRRMFPKVEAGYAQRGLTDSGIRAQGVADVYSGRAGERAQARAGLNEELYDLVTSNLASYGVYTGERFDNALSDAIRRAQIAAAIRGVTA